MFSPRRDLDDLMAAVERGDGTAATTLTLGAIEAGIGAPAILAALTGAMDQVGERFQRDKIYIPEMLVAARAMKESMALLEPVLVDAGIRREHTAVLGTVQGDLHDIGKNLVGMMLRGANFEVVDLGVDVSADRFVEAIRDHDARIVGISALLTTTMVNMQAAVEAVHAADDDDRVRVVVGGAPVTAEFAARIGADGYAPDAGAAVEMVRRLLTS
jgi:5-methyltetrahydrofolate--homocysteine methyltransferase